MAATTTFTLNPNAPAFMSSREQEAVETLSTMRTAEMDLMEAAQGLLNLSQSQPQVIEPNADHEFADAFAEYAQENGLWGLPGSEHVPSEEEISAMQEEFTEVWRSMHSPTDEEDESIENVESDNDDIPHDCSACGIQSGENITMFECAYDQQLYCTGCMDAYNNGDDEVYFDSPSTWLEIATHFQEYLEDLDLGLDLDSPTIDQDYLNIWNSYLHACWHPLSFDYIQALGENNNWFGVRPNAEEPEYENNQQ